MGKKRAILWFRQDLRLHDNEALSDAMKSSDEIIPLYIFDERVFNSKTPFGFDKTGVHRARFIIECIKDLRNSLQELNSELYVRFGRPEDIIFSMARQNKCSYVFCNRERTKEEAEVQDALEQNLWSIGQEVRYSRGKMLYYTADLPFPINHTPDQFSIFRKETERIISIRKLIPLDEGLSGKTLRGLDPGGIPEIHEFQLSLNGISRQHLCKGGEVNALNRLNCMLWDMEYIKNFKDNQNKMFGEHSSMLSAYLSQGCLSPKKVYHELMAYIDQKGSNSSTYELFHHLIYRDFLRLMAKKYSNKIFQFKGIKGKSPDEKSTDRSTFNKWANAKTGNSFVDAIMTQLNKTGFISFKARETVATYLIHELGINWKMGAEYFESILLDYDPCSNWVNWNNIAGIGPESREKIINSQSAAKRFDPSGEYVRQWLK